MFNKNKKAIRRIIGNIGDILKTLELVVFALIQIKKRIDELERRVKKIENKREKYDEFLSEIVTCSKCSCLVGKRFVSEDEEGYYYCKGCKPKDIKKSKIK